jgi:non-ribosomal peptide synthase protein (TIGR01720 family)
LCPLEAQQLFKRLRVALLQQNQDLQMSLDLADGPLLKCALVEQGPDNNQRLIMVGHHLVLDGFSWRVIIEDLQTAYTQLYIGEAIRLPAKTTSFKNWGEMLAQYAYSDALQTEKSFWQNLPSRPFQPLPQDFPGRPRAESLRSTYVQITREETKRLIRKVPQHHSAGIIDILLAVLARTMESETGNSNLFLELLAHGREPIDQKDLDLSRTVGRFSTVFPIEVHLPAEANWAVAVRSVREQFRRIPKNGFGYGVLRYLTEDKAIANMTNLVPVCLNYVGRFDHVIPADSPFGRLLEIGRAENTNMRGDRRYQLEITAGVIDQQFKMEWRFSENIHQQQTIKRLVARFVEELRALITFSE